MNMNSTETGMFKMLMWFVTILVTLIAVGVAYIIALGVDNKEDLQAHEKAQDKDMQYVFRRLYSDSVNANICKYDIRVIKDVMIYKLKVNEIKMPVGEAILPKEEDEPVTTTNPDIR